MTRLHRSVAEHINSEIERSLLSGGEQKKCGVPVSSVQAPVMSSLSSQVIRTTYLQYGYVLWFTM